MCIFNEYLVKKIKASKTETHHISEFYGLNTLLMEKEKTTSQAEGWKLLFIRKNDILV